MRDSMKILGLGAAFFVLASGVPKEAGAGLLTSYNVNQAFIANEQSGSPQTTFGAYSVGYSFDRATISAAGLNHTDAFAGSTGFGGFYFPNNVIVPAAIVNLNSDPNGTNTTYGAHLRPGELLLHPGGTGGNGYVAPIADGALRYVVPTTSTYSIKGLFTLAHNGGTDVHVYVNGASIFDGTVTSPGQEAPFNLTTVLLNAGSKIDFFVGPGANGDIGSDSTGLFANITAVPEPSTVISAGIACAFGLGFGWRRRRAKLAA